jgi:hypothetical protein
MLPRIVRQSIPEGYEGLGMCLGLERRGTQRKFWFKTGNQKENWRYKSNIKMDLEERDCEVGGAG